MKVEFEEPSMHVVREMEQVDEEKDIDAGTEIVPPTDAAVEKSGLEESQTIVTLAEPPEVRVVRETLYEFLADVELSFPSENAEKTGP